MKTKVLIIGAGPYGVSLSYELSRRNIDHKIVGIPFSLWMDHMIADLNLRSNIQASEIFSVEKKFTWENYFKALGIPYQISQEKRIPVSWFREYARWVMQQLKEPIIIDKIVRLSIHQNRYLALTSTGLAIEADKIVLATGIGDHVYMPPELKSYSSSQVFHSYDTHQYENLSHKNILILGAGQSAGDTLLALNKKNKMTWVHRKAITYYHEPLNIPQSLFNIIHRLTPVFYFFPKLIDTVFGKKFVSPTIDPIIRDTLMNSSIIEHIKSIDELQLSQQNGQIFSKSLNDAFDYIISCTGYKFSLAAFSFLDKSLQQKITINQYNIPKLNWHFETNVPGLFMIGGIAESSHGPASRFMMGCRQAILNVTQALST